MTWSSKVSKDSIHPHLVEAIDGALVKLNEDFKSPFKVYSGLRTFAEQDRLYAQGRTTGKKGEIVTNARGGQSMHNYGLAVDMAPYYMLTKDPDDIWWPDPDSREGEVWAKIEECLEWSVEGITSDGDLEYEWGGRWKFRDVPHCQIRTTLTELSAGHYPYCSDVEWLVRAHRTFLFGTPWMTRRVQYLLGMQSYDVGPVDGDFGPRSKGALHAFQHDVGEDLTGSIVQSTVEKLVRRHQEAVSKPRGKLPEDLIG